MTNDQTISIIGTVDSLGELEEPSSAAFVMITTTPTGPTFKASVPSKESARMMGSLDLLVGIGGSIAAPYGMARALSMLGPGHPLIKGFCIMTVALLPLTFYWLAQRGK
ncbi:hypothetical protein [Streptomyces sp. NPDC008139]|uniref:hypothetical protein n=1 Tax=Streptomyces sp. NPDC008139 TaxID=3364814 RepID=UPI0036EEA899